MRNCRSFATSSLALIVAIPVAVDLLLSAALTIEVLRGFSLTGLAVTAALWVSVAAALIIYVKAYKRAKGFVSALSSVCGAQFRHYFVRDSLALSCSSTQSSRLGLCLSLQSKRLYAFKLSYWKPADDKGDYECVRFYDGKLSQVGEITTYEGNLDALTESGPVNGLGVVAFADAPADPELARLQASRLLKALDYSQTGLTA